MLPPGGPRVRRVRTSHVQHHYMAPEGLGARGQEDDQGLGDKAPARALVRRSKRGGYDQVHPGIPFRDDVPLRQGNGD